MGEEERDSERERLRMSREQMGEEERRERVRKEREATTSDRVYLGPMTSIARHLEFPANPQLLSQ